MDFLMDGAARSVIHRHHPARQNRETALHRHFLAQADTARRQLITRSLIERRLLDLVP